MKSRKLSYVSALRLLVIAAIPVGLAAQAAPETSKHHHHHYQLVDLGTFGGPFSVVNTEPTGDFINHEGTIVGGADTSIPTPEPACYNPVNAPDCLISHAFVWSDGRLTDLGTLRKGNFSFAEGINNRGQIAGVSENGEIDPASGFPPIPRGPLGEREN